jgi:hypothetical protein
MTDTLIVKVQTALNNPALDAMVYDETRSLEIFVPADDVKAVMAGRVKAYFFAKVVGDQIALGEEAPWQDW